MADDDLVAHAGIGHRQAAGGQAIDVDDDRAVHFLIGDFQPAAGDADFGPLVRGAIKIFGKGPGNVGRDQTAVASVGRRRAVVGDLGEDFPQHLFLVSADFQPCIAGIVPRLPDRDLLDLANAPAASDEVEDFRQDEAVDDMAADLDLFHELARARLGAFHGACIGCLLWLVVIVERILWCGNLDAALAPRGSHGRSRFAAILNRLRKEKCHRTLWSAVIDCRFSFFSTGAIES